MRGPTCKAWLAGRRPWLPVHGLLWWCPEALGPGRRLLPMQHRQLQQLQQLQLAAPPAAGLLAAALAWGGALGWRPFPCQLLA